MSLRLGLLSALALLGTATAAGAQHSAADDRQVSERDMRRVADDLGECITGSFGETARQIVLQPVGHTEIFTRYWTTVSGTCMQGIDPSGTPVEMQFPYPTVHAILADNLIRRDYRTAGPTDFAAVPPMAPLPAPALPSLEAMANMSERERNNVIARQASQDAWMTLQRVGICTARQSPEAVRQMALTRVGSEDERAALRGLGQQVGACIPEGASLRLRPAELRWAAALGYYRLARAAAAAAPQGTP